jgi:hypothetical protein
MTTSSSNTKTPLGLEGSFTARTKRFGRTRFQFIAGSVLLVTALAFGGLTLNPGGAAAQSSTCDPGPLPTQSSPLVDLTFVNVGPIAAESRWVNYQCTEELYQTITGFGEGRQQAYAGSLWRFYEVGTNRLLTSYRSPSSGPVRFEFGDPFSTGGSGTGTGSGSSICDPGFSTLIDPVTVTFENRGVTSVEARWVNYQCNEVVLQTVIGLASQTQSTFSSHLWRFYEVGTGRFLGDNRVPHP